MAQSQKKVSLQAQKKCKMVSADTKTDLAVVPLVGTVCVCFSSCDLRQRGAPHDVHSHALSLVLFEKTLDYYKKKTTKKKKGCNLLIPAAALTALR